MSGSTITRLLTIGGLTALVLTLSGCPKKAVDTTTYFQQDTIVAPCSTGLPSNTYVDRSNYMSLNEYLVSDEVFKAYLDFIGEDVSEGVPSSHYVSSADAKRLEGTGEALRSHIREYGGCCLDPSSARWYAGKGAILIPNSTAEDFEAFAGALRSSRFSREVDKLTPEQFVFLAEAYTNLSAEHADDMSEQGFTPNDFKAFFKELITYIDSPKFDADGPLLTGLIEGLNKYDTRASFLVESIVGRVDVTNDRPIDTMLP
jgi:hypothetical protein